MDHTNVPARWLLGGAGALALGSFLPWAEVGPFSKNGIDGDGVLTLMLAVVVGIAAWPSIRTSIGRARSITTTIATALALIICLYDIADVSSTGNDVVQAQVGIGLWMAAAGALAVIVGVVIGTRREVVRFSAGATPSSATAATSGQAVNAPGNPSRWAPDPTGRHELRYWNGTEWTDHVSDGGVPGSDPPTPAP